MVQQAGSRTRDARDRAEILVNGPEVTVRHVSKEGPTHDLEKAPVEWSGKAGPVRSSRTVRVDVIEILTSPHDFNKLREVSTANRPSGFIRRQVAGIKMRQSPAGSVRTKIAAATQISRRINFCRMLA